MSSEPQQLVLIKEMLAKVNTNSNFALPARMFQIDEHSLRDWLDILFYMFWSNNLGPVQKN